MEKKYCNDLETEEIQIDFMMDAGESCTARWSACEILCWRNRPHVFLTDMQYWSIFRSERNSNKENQEL